MRNVVMQPPSLGSTSHYEFNHATNLSYYSFSLSHFGNRPPILKPQVNKVTMPLLHDRSSYRSEKET
ncbi:hypothetical protein SAMN05443144_1156 [Fodinibius roseus]|uniref:Uncharacterized protein n=1 Tax=Fodinibius roseus TaxID=1194090 RepID=A0A1M5FEY1_9BACT|nr:hypothetical protein SAMN05443144_1156 [Fodinibius roseus]